ETLRADTKSAAALAARRQAFEKLLEQAAAIVTRAKRTLRGRSAGFERNHEKAAAGPVTGIPAQSRRGHDPAALARLRAALAESVATHPYATAERHADPAWQKAHVDALMRLVSTRRPDA